MSDEIDRMDRDELKANARKLEAKFYAMLDKKFRANTHVKNLLALLKADAPEVRDSWIEDAEAWIASETAEPAALETKVCRHCGQPLLPENRTVADGCPCNSWRGINHGLVDTSVCTCVECDPEETGASRFDRKVK